MRPLPERRLVILTEGQFQVHDAKTALGVMRYGRDNVVCLLDSGMVGRRVADIVGEHPRFDVPAVATLDEALALGVDALLIGIAPTGGKLPADWRSTILAALDARLDVLSGLHTFIGDDPEFAAAALASGARIVDFRRPPDRMETSVGRRHAPGKHVILTVGTDCAIGKMSVALELRQAANDAGLRGVLVPTGQTGMMIEGWGVAVDRLVADFVQGTCEWLIEEAETLGDWIFVEGQGSLDHPAYSSVTLGLIHGTTPEAMVMVHKPGMAAHDFAHLPDRSFPIQPLPEFIRLHEQVAGLVAPSRVVAVALNTSLYPDETDARRVIAEIAELTGLPTDDPFRFGGERLFAGVRAALEPVASRWPEPVTLSLTHEIQRIPFRDPFRIARTDESNESGVATTVIVELRSDRYPGLVGYGEGFPDAYYGETEDTVGAILPWLLRSVETIDEGLAERATAERDLAVAGATFAANLGHNGAAKCALDIALHDLAGKVLGIPVHVLLGLSAAIPPTDFTIGIDEPAIVAQRAARAAHFPALKIKLGGPADLETLAAVRAIYDGPIRVDANTGWTLEGGKRLLPDLVRYGVELIEQPFPARRLDDLAALQAVSPLPIVADESAVSIDDLDGLVGVVAGVNVKLAKCGGVGPAARMLTRARELGFRTFLGCMEETTVGIAASAAVASLADWVDLDGSLLLASDPFVGLELGEDCRWNLSDRPGLGVQRRV